MLSLRAVLAPERLRTSYPDLPSRHACISEAMLTCTKCVQQNDSRCLVLRECREGIQVGKACARSLNDSSTRASLSTGFPLLRQSDLSLSNIAVLFLSCILKQIAQE